MTKVRPLTPLETLPEVHRVLKGTSAIARLTGKSPASISNAKTRGYYPKDTHYAMKEELASLGYCAPASLWRQVEPAPTKECA